MSLSTLTAVTSNLPAQNQCEILDKISSYASILYGNASPHQLEFIAASLDEVSNGSGLQLIAVMLWPEDELPKGLKSLPNEILSNFTAINA